MPRGSETPTKKSLLEAVTDIVLGQLTHTSPQNARRIIHGVATPIVGNSAEKAPYKPAILEVPGALVGVAGTLYNRRKDGRAFDGSNVVERFANNSLRRSALADERGRKALRVPVPTNTAETVMEVAPGLFLPGPKGATIAAKLGRVAPKTVKAVGKVVTTTPKPIRALSRGVAETLVPFRQTKTLKGTTAAAGVATGISDTLAENFDPNYESSVLKVGDHPDDFFADVESYNGEPTQVEEPDFFAEVEQQPTAQEVDEIEANETLSRWEQGALALGALALGVGAVKAGRGIIAQNVEAATEGTPTFTGKKFRRSRGGFGERLATTTVQQDQPLRNAADEFLSPAHAAEYKHNADLINNVSIGARVANTFRTGKTPKTNIRTLKLAANAEAYAKELTLDEQRIVSDALLAQSALDDFNRTGTLASLNLTRDGQPTTPAQLRAMVAAARSEPKYVKYMDAVVKANQDLLKFRVARGTLSVEKARELAEMRPNYVRMSRDLETEAVAGDATPFNANKSRGPGYERNDEELQGVQGVTGVGNPFNALMDDWANHIRIAEHNDLRAFWLENMSQANPALVRRIPNGVTPNTMEGIHQVYQNGKLISYKVSDALASQALEFRPRQSIKELEMMRQIAQNTVTGPLGTLMNGFSFFKSPIYDTTIGMLLKPGNVKLGLINEALSKINPTLNIGSMDPTTLVSAFTGAARYAWDDLRGSMAQNLSEQLIKEHSWLRSAIGDTNVTALRDTLEASYENSIKSLMDETGITSLTMHGSPDPSEVMSGLESITPRYNSAMSAQLARDTLEARRAGDVGPLKPLLAQSKSAFARARATTIARTYGHLLEAMHNGFRYSMVAANVKRNPDLAQLASQARRISVDSAQHGSGEKFNKLTSAFMYANLTVQSLAAVGKKIVQEPVQFATNWASVALPLAAMHYLAMASDPDAREQHAGKSAVQKATSVTTFGGAEIPVDPIMRLSIAPWMVTLDHLTGAHDGNWNRSILDAMSGLLEGDPSDDYTQDMSDILWADAKANFPFAPEAFPGGTAALAFAGVDPGMSRVTGEASPIRMQGISGFDTEQKRTDALLGGWTETMLTALGGSFAQNIIAMADDAHRAYVSPNGGPATAIDVALAKYRDTMAKGAGVARPVLFNKYEQMQAVTDTNWQIVKEKENGIEVAAKLFDANLGTEGQTTGTRRGDIPVPEGYEGKSIAGTKNETIASMAKAVRSALTTNTQQLQDLAKSSEFIRNGYIQTADQKNKAINDVTTKRKYLTLSRRTIIQNYEKSVQDAIGDPDFSFDDYNPDDYDVPNAPAQ